MQKKLKWKALFIFLLGGNLLRTLLKGNLSELFETSAENLFQLLPILLLLLGLYGYSFNKKLFSKTIWQIGFFVLIIYGSIDFGTYVLDFLKDNRHVNYLLPMLVVLTSLLLYLIVFFGLYKYAFRSPEIWNTDKNRI